MISAHTICLAIFPYHVLSHFSVFLFFVVVLFLLFPYWYYFLYEKLYGKLLNKFFPNIYFIQCGWGICVFFGRVFTIYLQFGYNVCINGRDFSDVSSVCNADVTREVILSQNNNNINYARRFQKSMHTVLINVPNFSTDFHVVFPFFNRNFCKF